MPASTAIITACRLQPGPRDYSPVEIIVRVDDNPSEIVLYTFYRDEKSYKADSFINMTYEKAKERVWNDDRKYLQSEQRFMEF